MRAFVGILLVALVSSAAAQTPQPFPRPSGASQKPAPPPAPQTPPSGTAAPQQPPAEAAPAAPQTKPAARTPDLGGIPLYPNAVYLASYEAGRGQRYHLYGVLLPYVEAVNFYRGALKQKGDELFQSPPTHQFEVARFRDSEMAFPPSITIKDYTWGGSAGYVNPTPGAQPERFPTVIQIVPLPVAR